MLFEAINNDCQECGKRPYSTRIIEEGTGRSRLVCEKCFNLLRREEIKAGGAVKAIRARTEEFSHPSLHTIKDWTEQGGSGLLGWRTEEEQKEIWKKRRKDREQLTDQLIIQDGLNQLMAFLGADDSKPRTWVSSHGQEFIVINNYLYLKETFNGTDFNQRIYGRLEPDGTATYF